MYTVGAPLRELRLVLHQVVRLVLHRVLRLVLHRVVGVALRRAVGEALRRVVRVALVVGVAPRRVALAGEAAWGRGIPER